MVLPMQEEEINLLRLVCHFDKLNKPMVTERRAAIA